MTEFKQLPEQCKTCANKQLMNNDYRCARYNQSLCKRVHTFCQGKYYMDIDDGVSLYSLKAWVNSLSKEELELPLVFEFENKILIPKLMVRTYSDNKDHWCFYAKRDEKDDK